MVVRKSGGTIPLGPQGAIVGVAQSKAPIVFDEVDESLTVSEGGLFPVPVIVIWFSGLWEGQVNPGGGWG